MHIAEAQHFGRCFITRFLAVPVVVVVVFSASSQWPMDRSVNGAQPLAALAPSPLSLAIHRLEKSILNQKKEEASHFLIIFLFQVFIFEKKNSK